jgi:hypothetical protein
MPAECLEELCDQNDWMQPEETSPQYWETAHAEIGEVRGWYDRYQLQKARALPTLLPIPSIRRQFSYLAEQWRRDTEIISSEHDVVLHPAYQRIIGMGSPVVPYILRDLEQTGSRWFWALRNIVGENPVPLEDRGRNRKMVEAWVKWGRDHHYL